jgi:hypothetical protein
MSSDKPDVSEINKQLDKVRLQFQQARAQLKTELGALRPGPGAEDIFISHANEFQVEETLKQVKSDPAYFEIHGTPSAALVKQLGTALKHAVDLNGRMENLVTMREDIIQKVDPKHNRTHIWLGREFVVLHDQKALKYLDNGEVKSMAYETVGGEKPKSKGKDRGR